MHEVLKALSRISPITGVKIVRKTQRGLDKPVHEDRLEIQHKNIPLRTYAEDLNNELSRQGFNFIGDRQGNSFTAIRKDKLRRGLKALRITIDPTRKYQVVVRKLKNAVPTKFNLVERALLYRTIAKTLQN